MKRLLSICVGALLLLTLPSCQKTPNEVSYMSSSSPSDASNAQTPPENAGLRIPVFSKFNFELRNTAYTLTLEEEGGTPQEIVPYNVKINPNRTQNVQAMDPVQNSPMISFEMGRKAVTVRIRKKASAIRTAQVHPLSAGIEAAVTDGEVSFTLTEPRNVCVTIDGERYEKVYVFAGEHSQAPSGDKVTVIQPGLKNCSSVGTQVWAGGLRDIRTYPDALTAADIARLSSGENVEGYDNRWALENGLENEKKPTEQATLYGEPAVAADYQGTGKSALVMNGFEDCVITGSLSMDGDFSVSTWVYLDPERTGAARTILNYLLFVRSDGTIGSNIGDWQFPYVSSNTLTAGEWHHVTLVKQDHAVTVYIDGESGGTEERPEQTGSITLILGSGSPIKGVYVKNGETLYLEPGAVLRGTVFLYGVKNAAVMGRGIINTAGEPANGILCAFTDGASIEGVTVNNPQSFNLALGQSRNVTIRDFKCFSSFGAADGINIKACHNITVEDSFVRSNDDAVSVYATSVSYLGGTSDVTVRGTTLISDAGHVVMTGIHGQEYGADVIERLIVEDVDMVDSKSWSPDYQGVMAVNAGNDVTVRDVEFRNIRVEDIRINQLLNLRVCYNPAYNKTPGKGVENIRFIDIRYTGENLLPSILRGYDENRTVKDVLLSNVTVNGTKLTADSQWLQIETYVSGVNCE